jgi:hypothetical protein
VAALQTSSRSVASKRPVSSARYRAIQNGFDRWRIEIVRFVRIAVTQQLRAPATGGRRIASGFAQPRGGPVAVAPAALSGTVMSGRVSVPEQARFGTGHSITARGAQVRESRLRAVGAALA